MIMVGLVHGQCAVVGTRDNRPVGFLNADTSGSLFQAPTSKLMVGKTQADVKINSQHLCRSPS